MSQAVVEQSGRYDRAEQEWRELTPAAEKRIEIETRAVADQKLGESEFWDEALEGHNPITAELPYLLARCARRVVALELPGMAVESQQLLYDAIAADVVAFVKRQGRERALAQALPAAEEEFERGEL